MPSTYQEILATYKEKEDRRRRNRTKHLQKLNASSRWNESCLPTPNSDVTVIRENGLGDEILTTLFIPELCKTASSVTWITDEKLKSVLSRSFAKLQNLTFITEQNLLPDHGPILFSWELIKHFRPTLESWNTNPIHPWLYPNSLATDLRTKYSSAGKTVIGLAWRSQRPGEPPNNKTCDLIENDDWRHILDTSGATFISLQYDHTANELDEARRKYNIEIYDDETLETRSNPEDAVAQIAACDYVVTISTTATHYAGALAVPGTVLLDTDHFIHWDFPTYPTLKRSCQKSPGNWASALQSAKLHLRNHLSDRPAR